MKQHNNQVKKQLDLPKFYKTRALIFHPMHYISHISVCHATLRRALHVKLVVCHLMGKTCCFVLEDFRLFFFYLFYQITKNAQSHILFLPFTNIILLIQLLFSYIMWLYLEIIQALLWYSAICCQSRNYKNTNDLCGEIFFLWLKEYFHFVHFQLTSP